MAEDFFNLGDEKRTHFVGKADRGSGGSGPTGPADSMDIMLRLLGKKPIKTPPLQRRTAPIATTLKQLKNNPWEMKKKAPLLNIWES